MSDSTSEESDWDGVFAKLRRARSKSRGYANYWEWPSDRALAEANIASVLAEYLEHAEGLTWKSIQSIKDDPPDVLLLSTSGNRVGVEVTELVDEAIVARHRHQKNLGAQYIYDWADWTSEKIAAAIVQAVERKDRKLASRSSQYDEVFVVVYTDEPMITVDLAQQALLQSSASVEHIQRAFMLLSYHPAVDKRLFPQGIPVFSIPLQRT